MTFIGPNLYFADDATNKIYRGSIPHGINVTTDPLALAANGTSTLYVLIDALPRDKILTVDPSTGATTNSYDAPDAQGAGLTYLGAFLYYASNNDSPRKIYQLDPGTGAQQASIAPQYPWGDMHDNLLGLSNDGTDLVLSTSRDDFWNQCLEVIDSTTGFNEGELCAGNAGLALANKIYKTTVPSGIQITTDPRALAYGTANSTTTLFILVDGTPVDRILLVDPADGSLAGSYDAPDDSGEGLSYLSGSLYYASNKDSNRKIYRINPDTGAQTSSFNPQNQWGDINENLLGLGNDGNDLLVSTNNPWDPCLQQVDSGTGANQGQLCANGEQGMAQAKGVAVAPDGFILVAKNDEIVQLTPEGQENARWAGLINATDVQGLTYIGTTLYVAEDDTNKVFKTTVPSGIQVSTDPVGLAYGMANATTTLFVLVDGTPRDKVLLVDPLVS